MLQHRRERLFGAGAVLLAALASPILLIVSVHNRPALAIKTDVDLRALARGFYPFETNDQGPYVWTRPHAELSVAGLDRRVDWRFTGDVMVWRPSGVPPPKLRIAVDEVVGLEDTIADTVRLDIPIPRRADMKGATLTLDTTPGFVPGPQDSRELGVAIRSMAIAPAGGVPLPPIRALAAGTLAVLAIGASLLVIGVPAMWILGSVTVTAWCQAWLMTHGLAAFLRYPIQAAEMAAWLGLGTVVAVWALERIRGLALSRAALGVIAISLTASYLKLLVLLHPDMPIGDGMFHAHRFQYVLDGRFYFTSLAPGGYAFPYPILLYLVAAPFSFWTPDVTADIALLRIVVIVADAAAGAMLYWMMVRATSDRLVAVTSVVWYHLVPMTAWIMTWGNLTNAFGQTLFVASLAVVIALPVEWTRRRSVALLALVAAAAMLSHPSTSAILAMVLALTAILYQRLGGKDLRSGARGVASAICLAAVIAFVLYYAWFPTVYERELARVGAEAGARAAGPASALGSRLASVPELALRYFGWPTLIAASLGAWRFYRQPDALRLRLLLIGWAGTCMLFLIVGVLTPIDLRYHFAAFPSLALAAAWGWTWAWRGRLSLRIAATVTLSAAAWVGIQQWIAMLP